MVREQGAKFCVWGAKNGLGSEKRWYKEGQGTSPKLLSDVLRLDGQGKGMDG